MSIQGQLFTHTDPRFGPATTPLAHVKGLVELVISTGSQEIRHHAVKGNKVENKSGPVRVTLYRENMAPLNVAEIPGIVALSVPEGMSGALVCWFGKDGIRFDADPFVASSVEGRCRPEGGYTL